MSKEAIEFNNQYCRENKGKVYYFDRVMQAYADKCVVDFANKIASDLKLDEDKFMDLTFIYGDLIQVIEKNLKQLER